MTSFSTYSISIDSILKTKKTGLESNIRLGVSNVGGTNWYMFPDGGGMSFLGHRLYSIFTLSAAVGFL
jgi:hypothetical protein